MSAASGVYRVTTTSIVIKVEWRTALHSDIAIVIIIIIHHIHSFETKSGIDLYVMQL